MSLLGKLLQGYHCAAPTFVNGRKISGARTPFNFTGSFQPTNAKQLVSIAEERRTRGGIFAVYTFNILLIADNDTVSDIVVMNSIEYEVFSCQPWNNGLINHYVYLVQEIKTR